MILQHLRIGFTVEETADYSNYKHLLLVLPVSDTANRKIQYLISIVINDKLGIKI